MKTSRDISKFVLRCSEQDEKLIRLKSNGLLGQYFVDENQAFRDVVIEVVLKTSEAVPVILLRDLFRALTESSLHAWSLDRLAGSLANAMMTYGGVSFLEDFITGWQVSFDTFMGINLEDCSVTLLQDCLVEIERKLVDLIDEESRERYNDAQEVFTEWIADCSNKVKIKQTK